MKKSTLFMACCIGLMLFASCKKDVQPTLTVISDPGYISQGSEVFTGDQLLVGFNMTGESLVQIMMIAEQNGNAIYTYSQPLENVADYSFSKTFTLDATGTVTVRGTVTDAKGHTATKSFDIHMNEKPNAKFVGHYEGDILFSGTANLNVSGMDPMSETLTNEPFPTIVDVVPGESIIEVKATITINGQQNEVKGTVEGNKVVFEAVNDSFTYTYDYQGFSIPIPLDMTYAITGLLNDNQLGIEGSCRGNGNISLLIYSGTVDMEGTLGGSLNKTR
jgi:hypothetical protein